METPNIETARIQPIADLPAAIVCTLDADEVLGRGLEWADVGALSLTTEHVEGGVAATFPISIAAAIEDLADREKSCCGSWLSTSTERLDDTIRLEITTENPDGLKVILSMSGLA